MGATKTGTAKVLVEEEGVSLGILVPPGLISLGPLGPEKRSLDGQLESWKGPCLPDVPFCRQYGQISLRKFGHCLELSVPLVGQRSLFHQERERLVSHLPP